jgi:hypothetical protein
MGDDNRPRHLQFDWFDFWYQNPQKIEALFSELNGRIETEHKETVEKGAGGTGTVGVEIGSLLAALGLAKGKAEAEVRADYKKILETTTSLSIENKIGLLLHYFQREQLLATVPLADADPVTVTRAATACRFTVLTSGFTLTDNEKSELLSALRSPKTGEPLIRIPLLGANYLQNQAVNVLDAEEVFDHEVFCTCIARQGWVLANPIAIWFPYHDPDEPVVESWTGERTPMRS